MSEWEEWVTLRFQAVLIRGDGIVALVNSGLPDDATALSAAWTAVHGPRAALRRRDDQRIVPALAAHQLDPADVTHLILTPLQLYTTANVALFRNAALCLSRRGWIQFHTSHDHPHDKRWASIPADVLVHMVTAAWDRVRLLDDEEEIADGLRTWWAGAHHRASLCVEVDTSVGTVAITDCCFAYGNVEQNRPLGMCESVEEALRAYERIRQGAAHLVPLYDPAVFLRYPGGVIAP